MSVRADERTYTGPEAARTAGITYRQMDHWVHLGIVAPQRGGSGTGDPRSFTRRQVEILRACGRVMRAVAPPSDLLRAIAVGTEARDLGLPVAHPLRAGRGVYLDLDELLADES